MLCVVDNNETELQRYLRIPLVPHSTKEGKFNVVRFWAIHGGEFPTLKKAAKDYLATPATSSTVERMFNGGQDQIGIRRYRSSSKSLRELMGVRESVKNKR
jgi:hypothetical protein